MKSIARAYQFFLLTLLYLPIVVLIAYSFNDSTYSMLWHGATLHWYRQLQQNQSLWQALYHSLELAFIAATLSACLSFYACLRLNLNRIRSKSLIQNSILTVIILPDILFAVAYLLLFNLLNIPLGFISLLLAHISFCIPFSVITINTTINALNKNYYRAAQDLGASYRQISYQIYLPLCTRAIISAWLFAFTLSFDDVVISYFVAGPGFETLPLKIYAMVRSGITPEINALCSLIIVATFLLIAIAYWLNQSKAKNE